MPDRQTVFIVDDPEPSCPDQTTREMVAMYRYPTSKKKNDGCHDENGQYVGDGTCKLHPYAM